MMKRILALHGHGQSATVFERKLRFLQKSCKDELEFVVLDAPHVLYPVNATDAIMREAPTSIRSDNLSESVDSRCWWRYLYDTHDVDAVVDSLLYVRKFLEEEGPFDGIIGFSQGAALAAMITGWLEEPSLQPCFKHVNHPPFRFTILVSGFIIPSPFFSLPEKIRTPSLHVIGYHDTLVKPEFSQDLARRFTNARVEVHDGGHFLPRYKIWKSFFSDYFASVASISPYSGVPLSPTIHTCQLPSLSSDDEDDVHSEASTLFHDCSDGTSTMGSDGELDSVDNTCSRLWAHVPSPTPARYMKTRALWPLYREKRHYSKSLSDDDE